MALQSSYVVTGRSTAGFTSTSRRRSGDRDYDPCGKRVERFLATKIVRLLSDTRLRAHVAEMDDPHSEEATIAMTCSIDGCPGEYAEGSVMHMVRHRGQVVVIDHVPADVCSVCGDVLLKPETVRRIESLLQDRHQPVRTVPLYEFA